ncbi:preprotein translocase subunit SecE [Myroides odoratimimus]|uniref:Protein translocase subunit SecE n=4 Tax=Myroides TaxID=76831 RepID=A0A0S7ECI5_9FLAO|nr:MULTISPECIES: preprotein translocase subunit SecE [Myroides]AJA67884.1 preprotein translocase, SecE subunit, bacterial [Myroides sp. A21]ALU25166.1 preprotein translocase subunit SecE [Myroides odoratimimus]APA91207.1 preprotein translocase subunit SecE [Myroides sp. ZB35]EHO04912.1 preprotein translocase, SecE subunit [Myroides odoratimimus CIP 101113]EHO05538.1 preprotein translocase, SecE subunit [Myroides odoratimimus CCUG 12901]
MAKVFNYISDAFTELKSNVTWSPWSEVQRYTIIVAIFAILFSLATWGVDTAFGRVLGVFYNWATA